MFRNNRYAQAFEKCREFSAADVARREGLQLVRKSGRYWARCPFHNETDASCCFDDKGLFYCFGCHAGGDAVTFYSMLHGVGKGEAALELSGMRGMPQHIKREAPPPSLPFLGLPDEDGFTWDRLCRIIYPAMKEIYLTEFLASQERKIIKYRCYCTPEVQSAQLAAEDRFWAALAVWEEANERFDAIWEKQSGVNGPDPRLDAIWDKQSGVN